MTVCRRYQGTLRTPGPTPGAPTALIVLVPFALIVNACGDGAGSDTDDAGVQFDGGAGLDAGCAAGDRSCLATLNTTGIRVYARPRLEVRLEGDGAGLVRSEDDTIQCGALCTATYDPGQVIRLRATEGQRSLFRGFGGDCSSSTFECELTMVGDAVVTAHFDTPDDVLVIVNGNSRDSALVGEHYAAERGVDSAYIAHVQAPSDYFITWTQFKRLRDQIIAYMQEHTLDDPTLTPVVCEGESPYYCAESVEQLRLHTTIRYLVTTRGVPTRMTVDGSSSGAPTSVDNYLRSWLINYYESDVSFVETNRERAFGDGHGMRTVRPAEDHELIIGRVDGLDLSSANALVDRAIAAEQNGVYGKLYSSEFRDTSHARWVDYSSPSRAIIYGDAATAWRYQLGTWGETRPECTTHLLSSPFTTLGVSPSECTVRLTDGHDPPPGRASSRQPLVHDALVYLGVLDGQPTIGRFEDFRNWRKNDSCAATLCREASDPAACRAMSEDPFREIDTSCMGVSEGFIGYNWQSFPVSYLAAWPTGWFQTTNNTQWAHLGGGDFNRLAFPHVRDSGGQDDDHALYFENPDAVDAPLCFSGTDFSGDPTEPCPDLRTIRIVQRVDLTSETMDTVTPQAYHFGFWSRGEGLDRDTILDVELFVHEGAAGNENVAYPRVELRRIPLGTTDWVYSEVDLPLDPSLHSACAAPCAYDGIKVRVSSRGLFSGAIGIDAATLTRTTGGPELLVNGSFDEGHEQVSGGDHAANFLSRLNGTAFWGSLSHHLTGGHSFTPHLETLIYWMRGLPLGDAVWFAEHRNSGILYGDPLYAPVAVRLHPAADPFNRLSGSVPIFGDVQNGRDRSLVTTTYEVDHCPGSDFYACDQEDTWVSSEVSGTGGDANQFLGTWAIPDSLPFGPHVLRLKVTSTHAGTGRSQAFFDYYPFHNFTGCDLEPLEMAPTDLTEWDDTDGDGIGNPCDPDDDNDGAEDLADAFPRDASEQLDTDGDGVGNNADVDDDGDGIVDLEEVFHGFDPLLPDAEEDSDEDGVSNYVEVERGTDPRDSASVPRVATIYVDARNSSGVEDGSATNPFNTVGEGVAAAEAGDRVEMVPGAYAEPGGMVAIMGKSLTLEGTGSVIGGGFLIGSDGDGKPSRYVVIQGVEATTVRINSGHGIRLRDMVLVGGGLGTVGVMTRGAVELEGMLVRGTNFALWATDGRISVSRSSLYGVMGAWVGRADLRLHNTILAGRTTALSGTRDVHADYCLVSHAPATAAFIGTGIVEADPLYVDPLSGDLHLAPGSPAIDAGDPASDYSLEPEPNGGRVNIGVYGNTSEASLSAL